MYQQRLIGADCPAGAAERAAAWVPVEAGPGSVASTIPGPGRRAFQLHRARGRAVVCHCRPQGEFAWPARLSADGRHWECRRRPGCGFYLPVEETPEATNKQE